MMFRLLNFLELENDEKNICRRIRIYAIACKQKAPIIAGSENVPHSQSYAYRRNHYHIMHLFKHNFLSAHIYTTKK